jgi:hypothetical protein
MAVDESGEVRVCTSLSSVNFHAPVKRGKELITIHQSLMFMTAQTLINSHQSLNQFKVVEN